MDFVIGVDVGTGSARAGVFDLKGTKLASSVVKTQTWRPKPDFVQQSSENIWTSVCQAVRSAIDEAAIDPRQVRGIGFDATCSLVVIGNDGEGLSIDPDGAPEQDIILWADHRALKEAVEINALQDPILSYVGGVISPEMETPKLLWLKRHLPDTYRKAAHFFDLPDYLTWRATGSESRSTCSVTCKWTYLAHESRWSIEYFDRIGLGDLAADNFRRIGHKILPIGEQVGNGLTSHAAQQLGLMEGTAVGVSVIDAHAGGIGLIGMDTSGQNFNDVMNGRLALIAGTSSCHMAVSPDARFVKGVWGPYHQAMIPSMWLTEAGQSAVGAAIDFVLESHAAFPALKDVAKQKGRSIYDCLNARIEVLERQFPSQNLTQSLHVLPDFNGNRAPHANPESRGVIFGLGLSAELDDLARLYLATLQGLAYGTRDIITALNDAGYAIDTIVATGGGTKNPRFLREHSDATGCRILLPQEQDSVLLGASILGAMAGKCFTSLSEAMTSMSHPGDVIEPDKERSSFHHVKYQVHKAMYEAQQSFSTLMDSL